MVSMDNLDRIITAKDYGKGSARNYIRLSQQKIHTERGISVTINDLDSDPTGVPVYARLWQSQWIADCDCNGASFVDPDEPVFFCFSCGNRSNGCKPRPVLFPENRVEIEELILKRPVRFSAGLTELEMIAFAQPEVKVDFGDGRGELPLVRSWTPGETVEDLKAQQDDAIVAWQSIEETKDGI
jgi:hypothetical protein